MLHPTPNSQLHWRCIFRWDGWIVTHGVSLIAFGISKVRVGSRVPKKHAACVITQLHLHCFPHRCSKHSTWRSKRYLIWVSSKCRLEACQAQTNTRTSQTLQRVPPFDPSTSPMVKLSSLQHSDAPLATSVACSQFMCSQASCRKVDTCIRQEPARLVTAEFVAMSLLALPVCHVDVQRQRHQYQSFEKPYPQAIGIESQCLRHPFCRRRPASYSMHRTACITPCPGQSGSPGSAFRRCNGAKRSYLDPF